MWETVAKVVSTAEQRVTSQGSQSQEIAIALVRVSLWSLGRAVCSNPRKQRKISELLKVFHC